MSTERLEDLERAVGVLIGFALGGPAGARLGNSAVGLHQVSPAHAIETALLDHQAKYLDELRREQRFNPNSSGSFSKSFPKKKRRASAYSKRYGKCFKKLAPKFKKKNGGWKVNGFKRCAAAARRCAKK